MNDQELDQILNAWKTPAIPPSLRPALRSRFAGQRRRRMPLRWIAGFALAAGAVALGTSVIKDGSLSSGTFRFNDSFYVRRTTIVHPLIAKLEWGNRGGHSTGFLHGNGQLVGSVYLLNRSNQEHYGYTLNARPAGAGKFLFTVLPLDPTVLLEPGPIVPVPHLAAPGVVGPGSSFDVDLYVSKGRRVFDHYEIFAASPPEVSLRTEAETALALKLTSPRLFVNGQFAQGPDGVASVSSTVLTVAVEGRGYFSFMLSRQPNDGQKPVGTVKGKIVEFQVGADRFRIESDTPVAAGGERPLFVRFQPDASLKEGDFYAGWAAPVPRKDKP